MDSLSAWSVRAGGEQDLVCDYWRWASAAHQSGVRFTNGHYSDQLAQSLDFIMKNQDQFTRAADACGDGLALIYPPTGDERTEAATWMRGLRVTATNFGGAADERVPLPLPSIATWTQGSRSL